jgi:hypothetical protein
MKSILAAATILSALAIATAAHATPITETYDFTASGFLGGGAPVDPWDGRVYRHLRPNDRSRAEPRHVVHVEPTGHVYKAG